MKKKTSRILGTGLTLFLCIMVLLLFGRILFSLGSAAEGRSYNFSLEWEGEVPPADWVYDQKGWQVFCQEGAVSAALSADGYGGFTGAKPGQTIYYSRVLTEQLDSPILSLSPGDANVAVFLDAFLLYTDCPELDNRIGYLHLPMGQEFRTEPVVLTLPDSYVGKTLTVAQSTPPEPLPAVWLRPVTMYQGSVRDSQISAHSANVAISAAIFFSAGALLLFFFVWQLLSGRTQSSFLFLALVTFLWSSSRVISSGHFLPDSLVLMFDADNLIRMLSVFNLMLFLISRLERLPRRCCYCLAGIFLLCVLGNTIPIFNVPLQLPVYAGLLTLALVMGAMLWQWHRGNAFAKVFLPLVLLKITLFLVIMALQPERRQALMDHYHTDPTHRLLLWLTMRQLLPSAIGAAIVEWIRSEVSVATEKLMMLQQYKLAQSSFENLQRHQEEVMMLRHDMNKHLSYLLQSTTDPATACYLEELLGQEQGLASVICTENQTMNLLLNAKLGEAASKHIATEVVRSDIPPQLPLSDSDLCALVMNLLDNAISAAAQAENPSIRLDLHQKDGFFVFSCENTTGAALPENGAKKEAVSQHGLGLKIINQIVARYGILLDVEPMTGLYRVTVAISLP